jgi:hypothetical protein
MVWPGVSSISLRNFKDCKISIASGSPHVWHLSSAAELLSSQVCEVANGNESHLLFGVADILI